MKLHELRPAPGSTKAPKRKGRGTGSGLGTTSGRGMNGQKSRSGGGVRPGFEGGQMPLVRRIPKRGFTQRDTKVYNPVNLNLLEANFDAGAVITPEVLIEYRIANKKLCGIKILGEGELTKAFTVRAHKFSKTAIEKIEAAGGKAEVV